MRRDVLQKVVSPPVRLKIAGMVSARPRVLEELSAATGVTIQAVLKHLKVLKEVGLVEESEVRSDAFAVRKVYSAGEVVLSDYSTEEMLLVKIGRRVEGPSTPIPLDLEDLAQDTVVRRRQVREQARRVGRMIDDVVEDEHRVRTAIESLSWGESEKLVLKVLFAEESLEQGASTLQRQFGFRGGSGGIRRILAMSRDLTAGPRGEGSRKRASQPNQRPAPRPLRDK